MSLIVPNCKKENITRTYDSRETSEVTAPLGKYTKYIRPPQNGSENASPQTPSEANPHRIETRKTNYKLLNTIRSIYLNEGQKCANRQESSPAVRSNKPLVYANQYHRTSKCSFVNYDAVKVWNAENKAFFTGVMQCGNVWTCPVCAGKIQEHRRKEIAHAIEWSYKNGLKPVMVTLTFPHERGDSLAKLLELQSEALNTLRKSKPYVKNRPVGLIRSLELTLGVEDWHPHTHELWFVKSDRCADELKTMVVEQWYKACLKAGLLNIETDRDIESFVKHSVDVKDNATNGDYLAKMDSKKKGADYEMAKATTKKGKRSGMHPFGIVEVLAKSKTPEPEMYKLWIEYTCAIQGKRQIHWSPKFKKLVGLEEIQDDELTENTEEDRKLIIELIQKEWQTVIRNDKQSELLEVCETTDKRKDIEAVIYSVN